MKHWLITLFLITSQAPIQQLWATPDEGAELHQDQCEGCHGTELYRSPARKISRHFDLRRQVSMCIDVTGKGADWFPEEQESVVDYLNRDFYQFNP